VIAISAALLAAATPCAVPRAEVALQAALTYEAFDSRSGSYGWRSLIEVGCTDAALSLLAEYAAANETRLNDEERLELAFHSGQALAFAGREREAISYFERATSVETTFEWRTYVAATLAFLRHDEQALAAARETYATIAPNSMRLTIIEGFVACPHDSYSIAVHCHM
jgi:tetratricopeptide (TPR) repeat protein